MFFSFFMKISFVKISVCLQFTKYGLVFMLHVLTGNIGCMFLSCHVRVSEWIHALYGWVFVYEVSGWGFESRYSHLFSQLFDLLNNE